MAKPQSERFYRMFGPLLDALREAGGEGSPLETRRLVADRVITDVQERDRLLRSGVNGVENEVAWARNLLKNARLIDGSQRGLWRLTEKGWKTHLTIESARKLYREVRSAEGTPNEESVPQGDELSEEPIETAPQTLIEVIKTLPPKGFERLCQHILRKAGFTQVTVTGRSGDKGIDGHGVLKVNELVSFQVLFQCKRYQEAVGSGEVRNFRGAMSGRTDKGIFLTTGYFTPEAQKEATREGVVPIELVDGEKLVMLMERFQIGVRPRTVFDVDDSFFDPFRSSD